MCGYTISICILVQRLKQKRVADQINYQKSLYKTTFVKGSTAADIGEFLLRVAII